jgi:hypothetical protein
LEEEIKTSAMYKPSLQARYLVDKKLKSGKSIQEVITMLTSQLEFIKKKVDTNAADLGKVREKVNLAMASLSSRGTCSSGEATKNSLWSTRYSYW